MTRGATALLFFLLAGVTMACGDGKGGPPPPGNGGVPPPPSLPGLPSPSRTVPGGLVPGTGADTGDALRFTQGGMTGHTEVRWDPRKSRLFYESKELMRSEAWDRQPSPDEWARFWTAMDEAGVWGWKPNYGSALHTDCGAWSLSLQHGGRSMTSAGCSVFPERGSFDQVVAEVTRLRGDASTTAGQALELVKRLQQSSDPKDRMDTIRKLGAMGPGAGAAAPALVDLLKAAPLSRRLAAPGPEPVTVARAILPLLEQADRAIGKGKWDDAIALFDRALARDPQSERAARGRSHAVESRELLRRRAVQKGSESSLAPRGKPEDRTAARRELAEAAEAALQSIGPPAVPALVQALEGGPPHRRRRAAMVLRGIGVEASAAVPALTRALKDPTVRQAAARALIRIDRHRAAEYLPTLITGLTDPDAEVAYLAAEALADLRTPAVVPALIRALDDNRTHEIAARGLADIGPEAAAAVPALLTALRDTRASERAAAAHALGQLGVVAVEAIPALTDALRADPNGGVRENSARALGAMGPAAREAVPLLIETFRYGDGGHSVASGAAIALGQIGLPAVAALTAALKCDRLGPGIPMAPTGYQGPVYPETENVRVYAAQALLNIGRPAKVAIPALRESLRDASPRVREAAARALEELDH